MLKWIQGSWTKKVRALLGIDRAGNFDYSRSRAVVYNALINETVFPTLDARRRTRLYLKVTEWCQPEGVQFKERCRTA